MPVSRWFSLVAFAGVYGCAQSARPPATGAFESSMPTLATRFADLDQKGPSRDACADLAAAATFSFSDSADGAAIVLTPRGGHSKDEIVDAAKRVEETFLPGVRSEERASCRIFLKDDEVNVHFSEGADGLRLVFETFDAEKTAGVKTRVKSFISEHAH